MAFGAPKPSGPFPGLSGASVSGARFRGSGFGAPLRLPGASRGFLASGRLQGASGRLRRASGGFRVVGFAFFGLRPQPPAWRIPNFNIFQATSWRRLASGPPRATPRRTRRWLGLGFLNNLVNHRKGERSPRRGSCPSTWRCSSRSKSLFRLA